MKSKFLHLLNDKLVKLVNLVMQSLKATKRQSDTTFFAKSLRVSESHVNFANYGVMDVRVSLGQYPTKNQLRTNLYLTPNRYFTRFAAVFALVFVLGVGNVWGDTTKSSTSFSTLSGNIGNDANISYSTGNGSATTATAIDGTSIKLYRSTGDNAGGILLLTANNGVKIKSFKITFTGTLGYRSASNTTAAAKTNYTSLTSGTAVTNLNLSSVQIGNIATGKTQAFISAIEVTYSSGASYTITAQSNNTTYGTVSLSGTTITGSPKTNCRYATPAYSVSPANSATVSQSGNTFTVTPSANTTVTINFEAIPKHTLNYHDGSGDGSKTNVYEGTNLITALGTPAASCDATSTTFVGWSTTEIATKTNTTPTYVSADAVVNSTTAAATYYAVYAKSVRKNTTTTYERLTNKSQITNGLNVILIQGSNNALNTSFSRTQLSSGTTLTNPAAGVKWIAEISGTKFKFKNSSGNYIGTANKSNGTAISSNGTYQEWDIITEKGSYSGAWGLNNGNDLEYYSNAFKVYAWSSSYKSSYPWYIYIPQTTYEDYITTCCLELGSINGSFFRCHFLGRNLEFSSYHYVKGRFAHF